MKHALKHATTAAPALPAARTPVRVGNTILAALLVLSFPLATVLPPFWGWENGPLEFAQAASLLAGLLTAAVAAYQQRGTTAAPLWWVAIPVWLLMLGRELAWGAAFLPAIGHNEWGPTVSSRVLWFRPAVPWVGVGLLLLCIYWTLRHRLWSRVLARLQRERAWPVVSLALFVVAMVIAALAESSSLPQLRDGLGTRVLVLEELAETWAYAALWLAQWALVRQTATWRR